MDTSVTFAPKAIAAAPYMPSREAFRETKVPVVQKLDGAATLPADKPFVAQIVSARLSGTEFPENPGEIVPEERTLVPYGTPMLPSEETASEDPFAKSETEEAAEAVTTLLTEETSEEAATLQTEETADGVATLLTEETAEGVATLLTDETAEAITTLQTEETTEAV